MADVSTTATDWLEVARGFIPYLTSGTGALGLYFYWRKIDADNRKRDKEDVVSYRIENRKLRRQINFLIAKILSLGGVISANEWKELDDGDDGGESTTEA